MYRLLRFSFVLLAAALSPAFAGSAPAAPAKKPVEVDAPIRDFSLPLFTKEGYRTLLLVGGEVRPQGSLQRIAVRNMHLTLFAGDAAGTIETVLVSAAALFDTNRQTAAGSAGVRVIRDDAEMSGERWTYDHRQKKVVLDGQVRVIFRAQLDDILR